MELLTSPFFGVTLTVAAYLAGVYINRKTKLTILNPLLISAAIVIAVLMVFHIEYDAYRTGANIISVLLVPATVCLAVPIYKKRALLKKYWLPVLLGCAAGAVTCIVCVWLLCGLFGLDAQVTKSILPKSITTPFGLAVSEAIGGIPSLTVVCIIITGLFGATCAPWLIKWFRVTDPVAAGLAIGTSSHALGTAKAIEIGETQGAMSGLAISVAGIVTVVVALFF